MTRAETITAVLSELRCESLHYMNTRRGEQFLRASLRKVMDVLDSHPVETECDVEQARR